MGQSNGVLLKEVAGLQRGSLHLSMHSCLPAHSLYVQLSARPLSVCAVVYPPTLCIQPKLLGNIPSVYCYVSILSGLLTLAMCPY